MLTQFGAPGCVLSAGLIYHNNINLLIITADFVALH